MSLSVVILAAGQGMRFKSTRSKLLHPLGGRPIVDYTLQMAHALTDQRPALVVGRDSDAVRAWVGERAEYVVQAEPLGTGHAVLQAMPALRGKSDTVLVMLADMPLIRVESARALVEANARQRAPLSILTVIAPNQKDFGRIVRDAQGRVRAIVEAAHATPEQLALAEKNSGLFCINADWLWEHLPRLPLSPKGEYYLTDLIALAVAEGAAIGAHTIDDETEIIGVNTRAQLAEAEAALRRRINTRWMDDGVTLIDPATTYIEASVSIGRDTVIWPNTHLRGHTIVGEACVIGPNTLIHNTTIGNRCEIEYSVLEGAWLADEVDVGPFAHLRQGARLERGVRMGNFGEIKNATLGPGAKMGHFSYLGDATIGANVNIGAGTITCNYDGVNKHHTTIGDGVFVGSDSLLVAPVTLGPNARTGAGAVVTKDVPADSLAVGMPARVIRKLKSTD
jgi:bifunctional UDP-N-acetylglucosamine pyrophosphorylase/glucosamine-1-phosphate N-acetyltransferase